MTIALRLYQLCICRPFLFYIVLSWQFQPIEYATLPGWKDNKTRNRCYGRCLTVHVLSVPFCCFNTINERRTTIPSNHILSVVWSLGSLILRSSLLTTLAQSLDRQWEYITNTYSLGSCLFCTLTLSAHI